MSFFAVCAEVRIFKSRVLPLPRAGVELGRDGARQGMVLLKNANGVLPLANPSSYSKTVVSGTLLMRICVSMRMLRVDIPVVR